jgi:Flp pilus assembly protein TadD
MLGQMYLGQQKLSEAIAEFEALAKRQPKNVGAPTMIAMILQIQGRQAEARKKYEEVLQIDGRAPVAANNLAWMYAEGGGNLDVALQLAQTAKEQLPDTPEVNDTLGFVYLKKDLANLAIPPLQAAVEKDPQNPSYRYRLGLAYVRTGNKDAARRELQQALKLRPDFPEAADARRTLAELGTT